MFVKRISIDLLFVSYNWEVQFRLICPEYTSTMAYGYALSTVFVITISSHPQKFELRKNTGAIRSCIFE
jgi:hypothetical protein